MKKNNTIIIILTILLFAVAAVFIANNKDSSISSGIRAFAVEDTASIDKIFLADRKGNTILLKRTGTIWMVNDRFQARPDAIKTLLYTIKNLRVQSPVARTARNTIIKDLAAGGIKCEIYTGGKLEKTYYVGGANQDNLGTYMILKDASDPFVIEIPGFNGYLTTRYITRETEWKDAVIFRYGTGQIASLSIRNGMQEDLSFELKLQGSRNFTLLNAKGTPVNDPDSMKVFSLLSRFQGVSFEFIYDAMPQSKMDSILSDKPLYTIQIKGTDGKENEVRIYQKAAPPEQKELYKSNSPYDADRMYAKIPSEAKLVSIQHFSFDPILLSVDDLRKTKAVK